MIDCGVTGTYALEECGNDVSTEVNIHTASGIGNSGKKGFHQLQDHIRRKVRYKVLGIMRGPIGCGKNPVLRFRWPHLPYRSILLSGMVCLAAGLWSHSGSADEPIDVGIVVDGDGPAFGEAVDLFMEEITGLTEGEFDVRLDGSRVLSGNWSVDGVGDALNALYGDGEVDLVLALGFVSSTVAARMDDHPKPTFAPMALDSDLSPLPRAGNSSGVSNLSYLTEEIRFAEEVEAFREIVRFRKTALLMEKSVHDAVPELAIRGDELASVLGIDLVFVLQTGPEDDLVARIPGDADSVMIGPLPRMSPADMMRLAGDLATRGLPSYSLVGTAPVRQGLLAASVPDSDWMRLARRNALNVQAVLLGGNAGDQEVSFQRSRSLTINMETARRLGISPRFDVLGIATLLNEDAVPEGRRWSLSSVAREALAANLDIRSGMAGLAADAEREAAVRSRLRPQVHARAGAVQLGDDALAVRSGQSAERTSTLGLEAGQILYSEAAQAAIEVERHRQRARAAVQRARELDVVEAASIGFLRVLKARSSVDIRLRALALSRTNLDLARDRVRLGSSRASDVYRWESEVASARRVLLTAQAAKEQAMDTLNRLLHRPITERFSTEPVSLSDPSLLLSREGLLSLIDNQRAVDAMGEVLVAEGLANAPELQRITAEIAAVKRQVQSDRRAWWSPEVGLSGQASHVLGEHGRLSGSSEGETDWQVTLNLTVPLHLGGRRKSDINRGAHTLHRLELQKLAERARVEEAVRSGLHATQASYAAIALAARAAEAAGQNLALIQDSYERGAASIIDYLDARDAFLDADRGAADAVYDFLIDLMGLQRASGAFDFFLDAASMDAMAERIRRKVAGGT